MKIESYNVQSKSEHHFETSKSVSETLVVWKDEIEPQAPYSVSISSNAGRQAVGKMCLCTDLENEGIEDQNAQLKYKLIESFIYQLSGRRVNLGKPAFSIEAAGSDEVKLDIEVQQQRNDWGIVYEYNEVSNGKESLLFNSSGTVTTSDGKRINFDLEFAMSRSWYESNSVSIRMGSAKVDPLVIAYGKGVPELSKTKYDFDLDSDGANESISFAIGDSGFLALDKNGNGQIDDGSELFGPQSGDGFEELRAYDADGNGWIDEADSVFGSLKIFTISKSGEKTLFKLGEIGIGAIYLNNKDTEFAFKDSEQDDGIMRSSSIFLREDGTAGTVHHIDLSV